MQYTAKTFVVAPELRDYFIFIRSYVWLLYCWTCLMCPYKSERIVACYSKINYRCII